MIDLSGVELMEKTHIIFIPGCLDDEICKFLVSKRPDIILKQILWSCIKRGSASQKLRDMRKEYYQKYHHLFAEIGWGECPEDRYSVLETNISSKSLCKLLEELFYSNKREDDELVEFRESIRPKCIVICDDNLPFDIEELEIDDYKFRDIGSFDEMMDLVELMKRREFREEELELILETVALKKEKR